MSAQAEAFPEAQLDPDVTPDERYTLRTTMDMCRRIACVEGWTLDVAACKESHWAPEWFERAQDGLIQFWHGDVWCNPPFSDLRPWVEKAWREFERPTGPRTIAMLLPANRCEQPFWQDLVELKRDRPGPFGLKTYFLPGRIQFGFPGNPLGIGQKNSPPWGCVLLVWRRK